MVVKLHVFDGPCPPHLRGVWSLFPCRGCTCDCCGTDGQRFSRMPNFFFSVCSKDWWQPVVPPIHFLPLLLLLFLFLMLIVSTLCVVCGGRRKLIEEVEGNSVGNLGFVITVTEVRAVLLLLLCLCALCFVLYSARPMVCRLASRALLLETPEMIDRRGC